MGDAQTTRELAEKKCVPCKGETTPLKGQELKKYQDRLDGWDVVEEHHLTKTFKFEDFAQALAYVNKVGEMAEEQDHHPDIYLTWGKVRIEIWTHAVDGLTESDFVFAAKCDRLR